MKILFFFSLLLLVSFGCHKEHEHEHQDDECPVLTYRDYEVVFYTSHDQYSVQAAVFKSVVEQVLTKEAHQEGAIFETVTEQVLTFDAYTSITIKESNDIHIVNDAENNSIAEITCFDFLNDDDIIYKEFPPIYKTRTYDKVVMEGTGDVIPAEYEVRSYEILVIDAVLEAIDSDEREFHTVLFHIPSTVEIEDYILDQLDQQNIEGCLPIEAYQIVE